MELIRITTVEQLQLVKREWSEILRANGNSNPFIEFEWIAVWMKYLGTAKNVEILAVRRDGSYIGFFPFVKKKTLFGNVYEMIGLGQSNYMDFIIRRYDLEEAIQFLFEKLVSDGQQNIYKFHGILESSPTYAALNGFIEKKKYGYSIHKVVTPYINLHKIQMDQYMDKRKKLHRLDRREKRLHLLGKVEHKICSIDEMDRIYDLHDKRWKKKNDTSGFTDDAERSFYRELLMVQNERYAPIVDALYIEGKMIAFNYGYSCGNRYLSYVLGYDDDFESFSPGRVLEKESILTCVNGDHTIFDLSIGYEPYKFEWHTHLDYTAKYIFSSKGTKASIGRLYLSMKEKFIERLKENRKLVLFKRDTLGYLKYAAKRLYKNTDSKDRKKAWLQLVDKVKSFIWWKEDIIVMKKEVERTSKPGLGVGFSELQLNDALYDKRFTKHHLKRICTKLYGGYQAYYKTEETDDAELTWTNRKVLRLNSIPYIKELRKNAIWIEGWKPENLLEICNFVNKEHLIRFILLEVDAKDNDLITVLKNAGFQMEKSVRSSTRFGKQRIHVIENEVKLEHRS